MARVGDAALGIWMDVPPEAEAEYERWYHEQHFPERLGVPGFLRGRRWRSLRGTPRFFILYETESGAVLRSPAYLERLNSPTEWTRRVLPTLRNVVRNAYHLVHAAGAKDGPAAATLRLDPTPGRETELRAWYLKEIIPAMLRIPGVLSATFYEAEPVATGVITEERKLVGEMGTAPPFLCVCEFEGTAVGQAPAWQEAIAANGPPGLPLIREPTENRYMLVQTLRRLAV